MSTIAPALTASVTGLNSLNLVIGSWMMMAINPFEKEQSNAIRDLFIDEVKENYSHEGRPRWPRLSTGYAAAKRTRFPGRKILVASGESQRSILEKGHSQFIYQRRKGSLTLGSKNRILAYHAAGNRNLPQRPVFILSKGFAREVAETLRDYWRADQISRVISIL